jgi:hypothetical protein
MSACRKDFLKRLKAFKSAIESDILVNHAPAEQFHNRRARILRNGVSVVGFAMLEDFINRRSGEILERIGDSGVPFRKLPERLQVESTKGVLKALRYRVRIKEQSNEETISFIQEHAAKVGSTANSAYSLSSLALGAKSSNINQEDVRSILQTMNVDKPWQQIRRIASHVGVGAPSLEDSFRQAAKRRHKSAHDADADTEPSDLQSYYLEALGTAVGFDMLISQCLKLIIAHDADYLNGEKVVASEGDICLLDVDHEGIWGLTERDPNEDKMSFLPVDDDLNTAKSQLLEYCSEKAKSLVVRTGSKTPSEWYTPFI